MIRTLIWKEYREQRGIWLMLAAAGWLFCLGLPWVIVTSGGQRTAMPWTMWSLFAYIYGLICGSMLIAAEKESGTLAFLDILAGERWRVWKTKVIVGLTLTLMQAVLMAFGFALTTQPADDRGIGLATFGICSLSFVGFCWGCVTSTLFKRVSVAAIFSLPMYAVSYVALYLAVLALYLMRRMGGFDIGLEAFLEAVQLRIIEDSFLLSLPLTLLILAAAAVRFCGWQQVPVTRDFGSEAGRRWLGTVGAGVVGAFFADGLLISQVRHFDAYSLYFKVLFFIYFAFAILCGAALRIATHASGLGEERLNLPRNLRRLFSLAIAELIVIIGICAMHWWASVGYLSNELRYSVHYFPPLLCLALCCFVGNILGYYARELRTRWLLCCLGVFGLSFVWYLSDYGPPWFNAEAWFPYYLRSYAPFAAAFGILTVAWLFLAPLLDTRIHWLGTRLPQLSASLQILWLSVRQGWIILLILAIIAPCLAIVLVRLQMDIVWPVGTFLIGVACGLACFAGENAAESYRFLADRRLPLGTVWLLKCCFWLLSALLLSVLFVFAEWLILRSHARVPDLDYGIGFPLDLMLLLSNGAMATTALLFVVYGFVFAQCFSLLSRNILVASFLSLAIGGAAVALWIPSLFMGGVGFWQIYALPVVMLLLCRGALWTWANGRMEGGRAFGFTGILALAIVVSFAANFWWRAHEVPDLPEPFDVVAFEATMPTPEENKAARLIVEGLKEFEDYRNQIVAQTFVEDDGPSRDLTTLISEVLDKGWPARSPLLEKLLDAIFREGWYGKLDESSHLPLGVVYTPDTNGPWGLAITKDLFFADCIAPRMLQLQSQGHDQEALDHFRVLLATARNFLNRAPIPYDFAGKLIETRAFTTLDRWLEKVGPDENLLTKCLGELNRHIAERPSRLGNLEATYFGSNPLSDASSWDFGNNGPLVREAIRWARLAPWEVERMSRLRRQIFTPYFAAEKMSYAEFKANSPEFAYSFWNQENHSLIFWRGSPSAFKPYKLSGIPGYYLQSFVVIQSSFQPRFTFRTWLEAQRLRVALALFQVKNGRPAANLNELVPQILPAVPIDPFSGEPFHYRVSAGEIISNVDWSRDDASVQKDDQVAPGQGVIWSVGPDAEDQGGTRRYHSSGPTGDLIYLVPVWPKGPS